MTQAGQFEGRGYLSDVRVLELADEQGEYTGRLLAGLGAHVIKIEPPEGNSTRKIGPFLNGEPHPDRSVYFWHYNFGKYGTTLDLPKEQDRNKFLEMARSADVFLETTPKGYLPSLGITYDSLKAVNPSLIWVRLSPFGDGGPWEEYKASDLVHLALGGVMMCCGYDKDPITGQYDTPPVAPQMFQAYQIAGQMTVIALIGALMHRKDTGRGQYLCTPIHDAVTKNTEGAIPGWIYNRSPVFRQTGRHARRCPDCQDDCPDQGRPARHAFLVSDHAGCLSQALQFSEQVRRCPGPYGGEVPGPPIYSEPCGAPAYH